jgi:hypothetical protein
MRDQTDCHYPYLSLCLRDCEEGCRIRKTTWRKRTIKELQDQELEDEAFARIPQHPYECKHLGICNDRPTHCPDCPSNHA